MKDKVNSFRTLLLQPAISPRISLMHQPQDKRYILHILYAEKSNRGGNLDLPAAKNGKAVAIEVIDEIIPLHDINIRLRPEKGINKITLEPQNMPVEYQSNSRNIEFKLEKNDCHQMVVLHYD